MAHEIVLDMSEEGKAQKITRKRKRSVRDRTRYWRVRYTAFINAGFTDEEAAWGANNGLSLKNKRVKKIIRHRKAQVAWYIRIYNYSRKEAIEASAQDLTAKLESIDADEKNLYYELEI